MELSPVRIRQTANAYKNSITLAAGVKLNIFSLIENGNDTVEKIAEETRASIKGIESLLNGLVSLGFLKKEEGRFSNTDESSAFLVKGKPAYQGGYIQHTSNIIKDWLNLERSIIDGHPPVSSTSGIQGEDEQKTRSFIAAMDANALPNAKFIVNKVDFSHSKNVLDMGGGSGAYSIELAKKYPDVHAIVVDLEPITRITAEYVERAGLSSRVKVRPGDYHENNWGNDYDVVFLFAVIHQENPDVTLKILKNTHNSLAEGGRLVLSTFVLDEDRTSPPFSVTFALEMLVMMPDGHAYTLNEIGDLLTRAGFSRYECVEGSPSPASFIIAYK